MDKQDVEIDWDKVSQMDINIIKSMADDLHEAAHLEEAKKGYSIYLNKQPMNIEVLDSYTDCLEQLGEIEEMAKILQQYLQQEQLILQYEQNYKLLFKYAQTQQGKNAIQYYNYGIQLLLPKLNQSNQRDLGDAYAAIAEVYQTDLLQFKESEQGCVDNIQLAFKYDPMNLDAFLQLANYHLNKEDEEAAKKDLRVIYEQLLKDHEGYDQEFQLQVSKILVEVEQYEQAIDLLKKLIEQDQNDSEVLYMLAFSYWKIKQFNESMKVVEGIINLGNNDQEIWEGTLELKQQLEKEDLSTTQDIQQQQQQLDEWMDIE